MLPETYLSLAALAPVLAAFAAVVVAVRRPSPRAWPLAAACAALALGLLSAGIAIRWTAIGHPPVFGSYENSLACSWFLLAGTLLLVLLGRGPGHWRWASAGTLLSVVVVLPWGMRFNAHRIDLTISERSLWIDLHASVAWVAYVAATVMLSVAVLAVAHALAARRGRGLRGEVPPREWTQEMLAQATSWTFLGVTAILATGTWYSWLLFGEVWRWDIVEVVALLAWLTFGLALHLRLFYGWRGARLASLVTFGYVLLMSIFWALALFPVSSYHFFELPF